MINAPNAYLAWERAQDMMKHNKKLEEIKKKRSKNIDNQLPKAFLNSVPKVYGHGAYQMRRERKIQEENVHLLSKIVSIHKNSKKLESRYWSPKSLHIKRWKIQNAKINEENLKIVKKIAEANSGISYKSMEKDFQQFKQYAGNLSRYKNAHIIHSVSKSELKKSKLPPIEKSLMIPDISSKSADNTPMSHSFTILVDPKTNEP